MDSDMEILDIDEALKDDTFSAPADKDVLNILQQWKSVNNQQLKESQTQQNDQAYKINTRTFTASKRKSAQNLESRFTQNTLTSAQQQQNHMPMLDIGGLDRSLLEDTSPPSLLFASIDASVNCLSNSLITSADFSNINFLDTKPDADFNFADKTTDSGYTLSDMIRDRKALDSLSMSGDGTLIKDTQIAQIDEISLTLSKTTSSCSTMDNSTESVECNNRTIEYIGNKERILNAGALRNASGDGGVGVGYNVFDANADTTGHQRFMGLGDEMIADTTLNLVETSLYTDRPLNVTHDINAAESAEPVQQQMANETFKKPSNTTFDYQQQDSTPADARCETPESNEKKIEVFKYWESTPQTANMRSKMNKSQTIKLTEVVNISPIVASNGQLNATRVLGLNETYDQEIQRQTPNHIGSTTFACAKPQNETIEEVENPNAIYNRTYSSLIEQRDARQQMLNVLDLAKAEVELLTTQDSEKEFEILLDEIGKIELNADQLKMKKSLETIKKRFNCTQNSSEQSDTREISREAQDMRELTHNLTVLLGEQPSEQCLSTAIDFKESMRESMRKSRENQNQQLKDSSHSKSSSLNSKESSIKDIHDMSASGVNSSSISSQGERLLSRRSRLYDNVNLSTLANQTKSSTSTCSNSTSFTVQKHNGTIGDLEEDAVEEDNHSAALTMTKLEHETEASIQEAQQQQSIETESAAPHGDGGHSAPKTNDATSYKLAEKRERDRDRFKTIKIIKHRNGSGGCVGVAGVGDSNGTELNVPCIDDDYDVEQLNSDSPEAIKSPSQQPTMPQQSERYSRRDRATPPPATSAAVFNNNRMEVQQVASTKINTNYLTYKKPKDKVLRKNLPDICAPAEMATIRPGTLTTSTAVSQATSRLEARSLSRPRYITGLQKINSVSKATSASDLQRTSLSSKQLNATVNGATYIGGGTSSAANCLNRTQPKIELQKSGELKSPMGIKSKSFHNLSSNIGSGLIAPRAGINAKNFGIPINGVEKQTKSNSIRAPAASANTNSSEKLAQDSVFKVPKLVSGLRAPSAVSGKRAGLQRPSSGYYSLNVTAKSARHTVESEADFDRDSPTESVSSASSRGSLQNVGVDATKQFQHNNGTTTVVGDSRINATMTKVTTGASGIPKPSGLRPPVNIRSGLPRPSSVMRR